MPKHVARQPERPRALTDRNVLTHLRALPHGRASYRQLVRELKLVGEDRSSLDSILERLVEKGLLVELRSDHFATTGPQQEYVAGRVSVHRDGFGFLIPDPSGSAHLADIFLPPDEAAKAMHGDRAVVHVTRRSGEGRAEGALVRILRRAHTTVVGEFRIRKQGYFVIPSDDRIQQWIEVVDDLSFPLRTSTEDRVGALAREYNSWEDLHGAVVNVEILEFPGDGDNGVGRILEVLGFPDDFGVDVEIVIRKHHLPHEFPADVLAQARSISNDIANNELARRRDFRTLPIVTIDGETARDFDDAVHVDELPGRHYALQVHIADVSHYVLPDTPIDREAALRGTSVYFPDRAVPMLPVELSTDICSLRPGEDRLVLSVLMTFDRAGEMLTSEFMPGVISSAERMTYTNVFRVLEGDAAMRDRYANQVEHFERMRALALILNEKRTKRGSIDFDMPESHIAIDVEGRMTGVTRGERNIAHRIIEEFMLAANEAVASHLEMRGLSSLFRIHEAPDAKRVLDFEEIAAHYGYSLGVAAIPAKRFPSVQRRRDGRKVRRDVTLVSSGEFAITSRHYQKLIARIAGKPEERILSYLMLRSLKQARYSNVNEGHFALAASSYTHFTSPIRRYPDLIVHRILSHSFSNGGNLMDPAALHDIGNDTSFTERRAAEAERELVEWKKVKFMQDRVGEEFDALIISTTKFGFFVELTDLFVEGLVPIETLGSDRFVYSEQGRHLVGERSRRAYRIGDSVRVRLDRVDPVERKLQFAAVNEEGRGKRRHGPRPGANH